jgi:hypothetical protein
MREPGQALVCQLCRRTMEWERKSEGERVKNATHTHYVSGFCPVGEKFFQKFFKSSSSCSVGYLRAMPSVEGR